MPCVSTLRRVAAAVGRGISTSATLSHGNAPVRRTCIRGVARAGSTAGTINPRDAGASLTPRQHYVHAPNMYEITKVRRAVARAVWRLFQPVTFGCADDEPSS